MCGKKVIACIGDVGVLACLPHTHPHPHPHSFRDRKRVETHMEELQKKKDAKTKKVGSDCACINAYEKINTIAFMSFSR